VLVGGPVQDGPMIVRSDGATTDPVRSWRELFAGAYHAELVHFVAVARGEAQPVTDVDDGVRALEAVMAVNRSMSEARSVALSEVRDA
jgi:predicted dehydrogenase